MKELTQSQAIVIAKKVFGQSGCVGSQPQPWVGRFRIVSVMRGVTHLEFIPHGRGHSFTQAFADARRCAHPYRVKRLAVKGKVHEPTRTTQDQPRRK
ncbi:MAG: hypothetical protein WCF84_02435 [Anaerolineae bacterium]